MEESGFLNVFKPPGMTSHDVVDYLRRRLRPRKLGHGGTLDPTACGVLVCLVNNATKMSNRLTSCEKTYVAEAVFGIRTDTGDMDGRAVEERDVDFPRGELEKILPSFTGEITQTPPMVSAVKVGGVPLYKLARQGKEVERKPRTVFIRTLRLLRFEPGPGRPRALIEVRCSGGTYIRTLVEDMGAALGAPAVTSFLVRTAVGPFRIEDSLAPDSFDTAAAAGSLLPPEFLESA